MPINTNIDPNIAHAIWRKQTFPEGSSGIGSFITGFMGGRSAAQTRSRETSKVDDLNRVAESQGSKSPPVPRPKGNFLTDAMQGFMNARGLEREGEMTPMEKLQQMTQIQGMQLSNRSKELELAGTVGDQQTMATFMESMSQNPDFLSNPTNMPVFKTPKYQVLGMGIQRLYNQSTSAKLDLKVQSGFFADLSKLVNVGTPESAAAYRKIKGMVDANGNPSDEAAIELGAALKQFGATSGTVDIKEVDVGGKPFAIFQVPGSKAFQIKDLGALSAVDMVKYRSATRRRDQAIADMADPIKGLKKLDLQKIVSDAEAEMGAIVQAVATTKTAPSAQPAIQDEPPAPMITPSVTAPVAAPTKSKVERANELSAAHPDWTREQIIQAVNSEMP